VHEGIFGYTRSVTAMLVRLGLPTSDTLLVRLDWLTNFRIVIVLLSNSSYYVISFFQALIVTMYVLLALLFVVYLVCCWSSLLLLFYVYVLFSTGSHYFLCSFL